MLDNTYFTRREAFEDIKNCLENDYEGYLCELHNEVFNTDYYINSQCEAKVALSNWGDKNGESCGVFDAIEKIKEYEEASFGEVNTDFSNPERVANMLYYIVGDDAIGFLCEKCGAFDDNWNTDVTEEARKEIIEFINNYLEVRNV